MAKVKTTQDKYPLPQPQTRWVGIIFFIVLHVVGLVGTPLYLLHYGASSAEWVLFFSYSFLTNMAITVGYHRLFAHVTFKAHPIVRFFLLFFGAATFEESALKWASQHRQHHQFTDTDKDPHSVKKGLFYCHIGWIMLYRHKVNHENVKDLTRSRLVMHQHKYYHAWSIFSGIVLPLALGYMIGRPWGVFLTAVCLRMVLVMNAAFLINSYAHMVGDNSFDRNSSARDHWLGAVITNGEGYHSFHHKFPNDYRNGYRNHHWDPSKWFIYTLSRLGLASDLKRTPEWRIQDALKQAV